MKKLIIFDLDGTLIDTLDDLKNAVNYGLSTKNYPLRTREQIRLAIGNGVAKLVERSIPDGLANKDYDFVLQTFKKYYATNYKIDTYPYEGLYTTVLELRKLGYKVAVCTNKIQNVAEELVNDFFKDAFDFIQGETDGIKKKPDPEMIHIILNHFNVSKEETLYIGDTEVDEQTAMNSNVEYLLVTYGFRSKDELNKLCPKATTIDTSKDIIEYLKRQGR